MATDGESRRSDGIGHVGFSRRQGNGQSRNGCIRHDRGAARHPRLGRPIIEARKNAVLLAAFDDDDPIGFEAWLTFVANALVVADSTGGPFSSVTWPSTPAPSVADLRWFVDHLRMAIFAECALSLPDTGLASSADGIAPHLAFLSKLVARDSNLGRTHLFTLNYDTLFEQALELLGVQYFDGFTGRAAARSRPFRLWFGHLLSGRGGGGSCAALRQVPAFLQAPRLNPLVRGRQ
jgi:hypothetical protein